MRNESGSGENGNGKRAPNRFVDDMDFAWNQQQYAKSFVNILKNHFFTRVKAQMHIGRLFLFSR